ncbi:MAG TPA: dockerin type I repeat-containing protein [Oscillospiraceae bacterium]|nr:dockerin type I repeat-containing protein [Oscillospiraceae bacterium]
MDNTNATVIKKRKKKKYNAKKTCIILLSLAVLFAALAVIIHFTTRVTNDSYANCAVGDVNGDGKINSGDAILILKYMVGQEDKLFENQIKNADTNLDEEINSQDALLILRYSIGDIASIPYDEQKERLLNSSYKRKQTVTGGSFTSTAQIVNEWDNNDGTHSYQVNLTIRNDSDSDSDSWKAAIVFDKEVVSLTKSWDCNSFVEGKSVTLGGEEIAAGESAECGFIITAEEDMALTNLTVR